MVREDFHKQNRQNKSSNNDFINNLVNKITKAGKRMLLAGMVFIQPRCVQLNLALQIETMILPNPSMTSAQDENPKTVAPIASFFLTTFTTTGKAIQTHLIISSQRHAIQDGKQKPTIPNTASPSAASTFPSGESLTTT